MQAQVLKKVMLWGLGILVGFMVLGSALGGGDDSADTASGGTDQTANNAADDKSQGAKGTRKSKGEKEPEPEPEPEPEFSVAQGNAIESGQSYIDGQAFSRFGLVDQLLFEGFLAKDANLAADNVGANWDQEAAESATSYLDGQAFSRTGLIDQLVFEGFTAQQATYGVNQTGL